MTRKFLKETSTSGVRSLIVGQHQVHDSWDQIQAFLQSALSPEHADIFAEPYRGQGAITWMTNAATDPVPLSQLDPDAKALAQLRLTTLLTDITRMAQEKAASKSLSDQQWGALLQEIQQFPQGQNLDDMMFVARGQPIMTQWGMRGENSVALTSLLTEQRATETPTVMRDVTSAPPPISGAVPTAYAASVLQRSSPVETTGPWSWMLWLLFLLLLALIYWWLMLACAAGIPGSPRMLGRCSATGPVAATQARQDQLLTELGRLQTAAGQAPQCAIDTARAAPTLEEVAPALQDTDIDRARESTGGQTGDITVTLIWNGKSDLDLFINCPRGGRLVKSVWSATASCGGQIDIDANRCLNFPNAQGAPCEHYATEPLQNPVENAFFIAADPETQSGDYQILIRHYAASAQAPDAIVPFIVQVRKGQTSTRYEGTVAPGDIVSVAPFTVID